MSAQESSSVPPSLGGITPSGPKSSQTGMASTGGRRSKFDRIGGSALPSRRLELDPEGDGSGSTAGSRAPLGTQRSKFVLDTAIPDDDIDDSDVVVPKDKRGEEGSKHWNAIMERSTRTLEKKFGVAKHKVVQSDANDTSGNQTKSQFIQNSILDLLMTVELGKTRATQFDMLDVLKIPNLKGGYEHTDPVDWWDDSETLLWTNWDSLTMEQVLCWQWCINNFFSDADRTSSKWLKVLLVNSCTPDLNREVETEYNKLQKSEKGGVIYLYLMLKSCFTLTREVKSAIVSYLQFWKTKGLARVTGENMVQAQLLILGACKRLDAVRELHMDYVIDVLEGLCKSSNADFREMFQVVLQLARMGSFSTLDGITKNSSPMEMIEAILTKASNEYSSICAGGRWNVPKPRGGRGAYTFGRKATCWNCGKEGHTVTECKQPRNNERITENKEKWEKAKAARTNGGSGGGKNRGSGGGTGGGGGKKGTSNPDYQRKQWKAHNLVLDGGILKVSCKHCRLNFTHGTNAHDAWKAGTYTMADNHPLYVFNKQLGKEVPAQEEQKSVRFADQQGAGGGGNSGNAHSLSRSSLESKINSFERQSTDPNAGAIAEMFRQFLN